MYDILYMMQLSFTDIFLLPKIIHECLSIELCLREDHFLHTVKDIL